MQRLARADTLPIVLLAIVLLACDPETAPPLLPPRPDPASAPVPNPEVHPRARGEAEAGAEENGGLSNAKPPLRVRCVRDLSFPGVWRVPEASAAAEVTLLPGTRELLVLSDSGNGGEALLWAIPRGPFRPIRLTLDAAASDDLEGAAWRSEHLYTLTSSGAVRRFRRDGRGGLERDGDAYAIGPPPYSCPSLTDVNCGMNYEGLCLRATSGKCSGYAASKSRGELYCLLFDGKRLRIDATRSPLVLELPRHALSDCAFGAAGGPAKDVLLVTTNIYGGSKTYRVDEATGALAPLDVTGLPSNEAVAVDSDGSLYQLMDSDTRVSLAYRMTCEGW
jgi:hypothetical protein